MTNALTTVISSTKGYLDIPTVHKCNMKDETVTVTVTYYHSTGTDDPEPPHQALIQKQVKLGGGWLIGIKLCLSYMHKYRDF